MPPVISVENLSKSYRLGVIGTGTFSNDLKVWWARTRGKPNPLLKIGQEDHGNRAGEEIWALKDVSFQVDQGEVLGIIGRNGAGKSTLLKILSRVTAPTSGSVKVKGRIASLLEVGTGFHPELTGRENIYLNGAILGMTKAEVNRRFDEIVEFAEIAKFIDTPVKRYSSGMYVRLAFAVAAHLESEILLVDEVLAVGDAEFQKKCLGKMGDVASKEGRTVLFVSHNMGAVVSLCKEGLVLQNGGIISYSTANDAVVTYMKSLFNSSTSNEQLSSSKILISDVKIESTLENSTFVKSNEPIRIKAMFSGNLVNPEIMCFLENSKNQIVSFQKKRGSDLGFFEHRGKIALEIEYPPLWLYPGIYAVYFSFLNFSGGREGRLRTEKYPFSITGEIEEIDNTLLRPDGKWSLQIID